MQDPNTTRVEGQVIANRAHAAQTLADPKVKNVLNSLSYFDRNRVVAHIRTGILSKKDVIERAFS